MPESVRDLWEYDPVKAKELLAEAGYPNGFKVEVILTAGDVDELSIVKAYWAKIGVHLELKVVETGVTTAICNTHTHTQMIKEGAIIDNPHNMHHYRLAPGNVSKVSDPILLAGYDRATNYWNVDREEFAKAVREALIRGHKLALYLHLPGPYDYTMWWPWVENYHSEYSVGYYSHPNYIKYIWINEELKKELLAKEVALSLSSTLLDRKGVRESIL